ncbi:protein FAM177A1 [Galleria mellonella]|uniref:Protein FAM177A1 n=1 Tax=Galleria mellonella TaxID=7137 RepID=A0A6J1W8E5_GALME|nr:protein FAM177A1 [Galleria mellonella]
MEDNSENSNKEVEITINRPGRVLHFSDGVEEEVEENVVTDLQSNPPKEEIDPKQLDWGPWFSHYARKSSTKLLNAVDYAGESLAGFFGITTPKYQIEIDEYERIQEERRKLEEESAGWVPKNGGGDIPLVINEPVKDLDKRTEP